MINYRKQIAQFLGVGAMAGALAVLPLSVSLAAPGGAAGGHVGGGSMGNGSFGGQSGGHFSTEGMANTNGPKAADRDFVRSRADDRMGMARGSNVMHGTDRDVAAKRADFRGNGMHARDRDLGRARAEDRRNAHAQAHGWATHSRHWRRHHHTG